MNKKRSGKKSEKIQIVVRGIGRARPQRRREDERRGKSPGSAKHHFKPGQSGNPRGRPHVPDVPKFKDAYSVALMDTVPASMAKQLGVPRGSTFMDVLVKNVVAAAALASMPHVEECRQVLEGKLPNTNQNIDIIPEFEELKNNEGFRNFVKDQLLEYRRQILSGGDDGVRHNEADQRSIPAPDSR